MPRRSLPAAIALAAAPLAAADFAGSVDSVSSLAVGLSSQVNAWSSPQGLIAALGIQNAFPTLSSAVATLSSAAGSIADADVDPARTSALASSIADLLAALTSKAADFSSVGATQIVQNDVSSLEGPSVAIVQDIVNAVKDDCAKIGSLTDALGAIAGAFSSADAAYSLSASSFPAVPSCAASSTSAPPPPASSSAASSSAASSSSAAPSVTTSSSAPETSSSSAAPSSAPATSAAPTSAAPTSAAPTSAAPVGTKFAAPASAVSSLAVALSSKVNAWSSPQGLIAALGIQNAFPTLSSAVVVLSSAAGSVADSDIDPAGTSALASSIANLLAALTSKAADFSSVGATQIVQNDISSLEGPSVAIVQDIVNAVKDDCAKIGSLTSALGAIAGAFSSADAAYSLSASSFPAVPSCGGTGPTSGAPTTTAKPTSSAAAQCTSTVTNQGFACSANTDRYGVWAAANKVIHTLLNDVTQAANAIGFGLIADLATLATTLVNAVNGARTHLQNLECLAPSQAADFFASVTQTITSITNLLTGLNKNPGLLKIIPGAPQIVEGVLQTAVSIVNSYIGQVSSFLQGFPGNYPCASVTAVNSAIGLLNDAQTALNSALGIKVAAFATVHVTNCRNPTTVITTACAAVTST